MERPAPITFARGDRASWNAALRDATTPWLAVVPAGAVVVPDGLAALGFALRNSDGADVVYTDERAIPFGADAPIEVLKPGWSPRLILEGNYVGALCVFRVDAALAAGGFVDDDEPTHGYDLLLRMADAGASIRHLPVVLIDQPGGVWPATAVAVAHDAARRSVERSLARRGINGSVTPTGNTWQRVALVPATQRPVTIVIPTRDRVDLLRECVASVETRTDYPSFEIIIIDNGSVEAATHEYFAASPHRVVPHPGAFNFSDLVNAGAAASNNPLLLLLNNDTEVRSADWLTTLVAELADPRVGSVGCRLLFTDGSAQHEGIALGLGGVAAVNLELDHYCDFDEAVRDVVAVTAACVLVLRTAWDAVDGFDHDLAVGYGDVDFCLRLRNAGYRNVYTPHVSLVHLGQATRGEDPHRADDLLFSARWPLHRARQNDPFVNGRIERFAPMWVTPVEAMPQGQLT